jgi:hypothetical protein
MEMITNFKGERGFSFIRVFLFFLFVVLVIGGLSDFLSAKNQTNETKKDEVVSKVIPKPIPTSPKFQKKKTHAKSFTGEKHLGRSDTPQPDSEEKKVEKKENFSLFQGEKKLENLLLKAEEETAKGNYELAKFFYEKYLEEKKDPRVYNNYGGVLFFLGRYEEAERAFLRALSLEQSSVFRFNLILTKIKLNQTKEACQMFKKFQKEFETLKEVVFIKNICFF